METLLDFSPSLLTFNATLGQRAATQLVLTNVHSYPVAYKVKTTHFERYYVRPNAAILSPNETLTVEFIHRTLRSPPSEPEKCSHGFLLQAVSLKHVSDLPLNSTVTTVWKHAAAPAVQQAELDVDIQFATTTPPAVQQAKLDVDIHFANTTPPHTSLLRRIFCLMVCSSKAPHGVQ